MRPDAELMFFVPLLVLLAAVIGIELLRWPAVALVPAVAVLVLSQAFVALTGVTAVLAALGFAVVAAGLYMPVRPGLVLIPTVVLGLWARPGYCCGHWVSRIRCSRVMSRRCRCREPSVR
ncbi:hypothetical protein [Kibdelosporangium philippinense]|uniref:hypothetical protein n=1 Tax=Kibdelosporangium philippinense TaxID=211113 RepID=UPI003623517B